MWKPTQPAISANFHFLHLDGHASGAFGIEFCLAKTGDQPGENYVFQLIDEKTGKVAFTKNLKPATDSSNFRVVVNTHLLPNGDAEFTAQILDQAENPEWSAQISFPVNNSGPLAEQVRASMQKYGTPLFADQFCDSSHYDYSDASLIPWFDRPDAAEMVGKMREQERINDAEYDALLQFVTEGYLIVPDAIEPALLEQANKEIDDAVEAKWEGYTPGSSQRLTQLHQKYPGLRKIWQHPVAFRYLELIFGVPAKPCQTLVFVFGSQQKAHQDSIHLTPFPSGYMCGVWIPLEDVQPDSGELEIYPKSHRLPRITMKSANCPKVVDGDYSNFGKTVVGEWTRIISETTLEKIAYRPKSGTLLIWHENLLHAGSARKDLSLSRRSVVVHAFAEGAVAYYDSTGLPGFTYRRE